jgi:FkbM family methyltransferase
MIHSNSEADTPNLAFDALYENFLKKIDENISSHELVVVDVGAGPPFDYSNMKIFREMGAKVVCIDPMPSHIKMFESVGLPILQYAVIEDDSLSEVLFREFPNSGHRGLAGSTIASVSDSLKGCEPHLGDPVHYMVPAKSLTSILKQHHPEITDIDVLDIDTEGNEIGILKGLDLNYYKPKVLIIENIYVETSGYDDYYKSIGYTKYARCTHNDIVIRNI